MSDINTTGTVSISQDYTNNYRNQMQESLIDAINILYKGAVAKENISKTLECIISDASERDKGIYKVDYMKNIFEVSCPLSTLYDVGDAVFVLVPDGDFSKTKIIVGSAEGNTGGSSGTDVEANPAGTATDILEKLRVGTTIYSVEGGSTDVVTDVKVNGASVVGSDHVARISAVTQAQLENALETKADATDLTDLEETVNDLITTVSEKANQSSLEALTTIVRTKANSADVNAALNLKANQSDLNDLATIVDSKANQSEVTAIKDGAIIDSFGDVENALTSKQDTLAFDNVPTQNSNNPVTSGGIYSALINKVNSDDIGTAAAKDYIGSVTKNSTDLVTSGAVYTAIDNLPEPMVFKGSLGTGGTITTLPVDGSATIGDTYKVITAGTYVSQTAKVGDTFICDSKTSSANTWVLIPSGDEPSGTVTSITLKATSPIAIDSSSAITTSGTRTLSHVASGATAGSYGDSGNQTPGYGSTFKVPYVTVNATGHVTDISEHTVKIPASDNTNTTYTFANGTNQFTVTPSGGSAQTVKVTPDDTTKLPLAGGNMTGNIGYTGSKSTSSMIKFMNNTSDAYGNGICVGGGGATIIGGGESSDVMAGQVNAGNEILYLGNDGDVNIFTNLQNGWDSRKTFTFSANGNVTFAGSFTANSIDATKLSGTIPSGCYTDTKYTAATAAPGAIAASGSAGTSTNYARQDHTHGIAVATGDSNGQVKIAGQNVSVKGLGSAAYTASSAYAPAGNYAGSSSAGGAANSLANFKVTNNTNLGIDDPGSNAIGYVSGLTKAAWNYQQTDGALYTQRYSDKWIVEMFQDYRTGQVSVRGKNNGTWQGWRNILDSSNYASYVTPAGIGAAPASHTHTISQVTWGPGQNLTTSATANGQEWSIDLTPGSYTGTYFHVWSSKNSKSILCCYPDDNSVTIPNGSLNVSGTIKQNGTAVSLNGHTHNYAGSSSAGGVATSAAKLSTARSIALGGDFAGSANFDGSANITISGNLYWCTVNGGNTANYPWHRIAYCSGKSGQLTDVDATFIITSRFDGGGFGVLKVSLRTNGSGGACSTNARWLYRTGFGTDSVVITHWGTTGQSVYADIFLKCGQWPRVVVYQIVGDRAWTLVNSREVDNTTASDKKGSTECYASVASAATEIHSKAYTSTKNSVDSGTVNYANDSGTVNGKTVAVNVPSNAKFTDTTYTTSTTSVGSASAGTAIAADDITAWSAGTMTSASYSKGVLTISNGSAPSLSYTARSIPNISVSNKTVVTGITAN